VSHARAALMTGLDSSLCSTWGSVRESQCDGVCEQCERWRWHSLQNITAARCVPPSFTPTHPRFLAHDSLQLSHASVVTRHSPHSPPCLPSPPRTCCASAPA
jgi:hypothetical protein